MRTLTSATSVPSRARTRARRSTATCRPSSSTPAWDAFRHGYWFALIGFGTGISAEEAALLGAAHELGAWVAKGNEKPNVDYGGWDSNNDLHNNQVGYGIGQDLWRHPQTQPYFSAL